MQSKILFFVFILFAFFISSECVAQKKNKDKRFEIGAIVKVGNFEYKVNSYNFEKSIGNDFYSKTADGVYLIINLTIKNVSKESRTLDGSMFYLYDSRGTKFEYSTEGATALELVTDKTMFLKDFHPNIPTEGQIVFEVPSADDHYLLQVTGGFWSGKQANIQIK